MAKKPRRRGRFNLRRVRVSTELALLTLASDTALVGSLTGAAGGAYRVISSVMTWAITKGAAGEGPITVGYAHSDYTVAEIKECLEAFASIDQGDKIAQERANRLIRVVGTISLGAGNMSVLNDGRTVKTKLNWLINIGDSVNQFAFNESTGALTTGAVTNVQGNLWIQDSS